MTEDRTQTRTQLQALSDGTRCTTFTTDKLTRSELAFIQEVIEEGTNLNPSLAVIMRRALIAYADLLRKGIMDATEAVIKDKEQGMAKLQAFFNEERYSLFQAAGKPIRPVAITEVEFNLLGSLNHLAI